jgi:uncharacterized protein YqjF (DUF2071 family)
MNPPSGAGEAAVFSRPSASRVRTTEESVRPRRAWVWSQQWRDLLFLHWRVSQADIRGAIPKLLETDTFDGSAWLTIVVFRLATRPRFGPFIPGVSFLTEANLRTYVRYRGRPGITFLAIQTPNRLAAWLARLLTPLPYRRGEIRYDWSEDRFTVTGDGFGEPGSPFGLAFVPEPGRTQAEDGGFADWLLERYRVFAGDRRGVLREAEVEHSRWHVQSVRVLTALDGNEPGWGLPVSRRPDVAHFSTGTDSFFGPFRFADRHKTCVD